MKIYGIHIPENFIAGNWTNSFAEWLNQLSFVEPSSKLSLQNFVQQANFLITQRNQIDQQIQTLAAGTYYAEKTKLLATIPVGRILTAMIFLTETGDMSRAQK